MKSLNDARGQYKRYKSYYDMCNTRTATIYNAMGEPCNLKVPSIFPGPKQSTKKRNRINQPRLSLVVRQSFLSRHDLSSQKLFKDFDDLSSEDDEKRLIYNPQLNETITTIYHLFAERSRIMSNGKIHKRGLLKGLTLRNIMTKYFERQYGRSTATKDEHLRIFLHALRKFKNDISLFRVALYLLNIDGEMHFPLELEDICISMFDWFLRRDLIKIHSIKSRTSKLGQFVKRNDLEICFYKTIHAKGIQLSPLVETHISSLLWSKNENGSRFVEDSIEIGEGLEKILLYLYEIDRQAQYFLVELFGRDALPKILLGEETGVVSNNHWKDDSLKAFEQIRLLLDAFLVIDTEREGTISIPKFLEICDNFSVSTKEIDEEQKVWKIFGEASGDKLSYLEIIAIMHLLALEGEKCHSLSMICSSPSFDRGILEKVSNYIKIVWFKSCNAKFDSKKVIERPDKLRRHCANKQRCHRKDFFDIKKPSITLVQLGFGRTANDLLKKSISYIGDSNAPTTTNIQEDSDRVRSQFTSDNVRSQFTSSYFKFPYVSPQQTRTTILHVRQYTTDNNKIVFGAKVEETNVLHQIRVIHNEIRKELFEMKKSQRKTLLKVARRPKRKPRLPIESKPKLPNETKTIFKQIKRRNDAKSINDSINDPLESDNVFVDLKTNQIAGEEVPFADVVNVAANIESASFDSASDQTHASFLPSDRALSESNESRSDTCEQNTVTDPIMSRNEPEESFYMIEVDELLASDDDGSERSVFENDLEEAYSNTSTSHKSNRSNSDEPSIGIRSTVSNDSNGILRDICHRDTVINVALDDVAEVDVINAGSTGGVNNYLISHRSPHKISKVYEAVDFPNQTENVVVRKDEDEEKEKEEEEGGGGERFLLCGNEEESRDISDKYESVYTESNVYPMMFRHEGLSFNSIFGEKETKLLKICSRKQLLHKEIQRHRQLLRHKGKFILKHLQTTRMDNEKSAISLSGQTGCVDPRRSKDVLWQLSNTNNDLFIMSNSHSTRKIAKLSCTPIRYKLRLRGRQGIV